MPLFDLLSKAGAPTSSMAPSSGPAAVAGDQAGVGAGSAQTASQNYGPTGDGRVGWVSNYCMSMSQTFPMS